jgi:hypothetical protein
LGDFKPSINSSPWIRTRPTTDFPDSCAESDRAAPSQSSAALPFSSISSALKPARCHRKTVSGCTTWTVSIRLGHSRIIQPRNPITAVQSQPRRRSPHCDIQLMTKKQILGFKPAARLKQVADEHSECMKERKHRHS